MLFQNFNYEKADDVKQLEVGDYTARIDSAIEKYASQTGNAYVEVTVSIKGMPGYVPNKMVYYDIPKVGDQKANGQQVTAEDVKKANQKMSRFLEAFGIPTEAVSNFASWKGKIGTVHCDWQYDPKEADKKSKQYKSLFPKVQKKEEAPGPSTAPVPTPSAAKPTEQKQDEFPEDIPF